MFCGVIRASVTCMAPQSLNVCAFTNLSARSFMRLLSYGNPEVIRPDFFNAGKGRAETKVKIMNILTRLLKNMNILTRLLKNMNILTRLLKNMNILTRLLRNMNILTRLLKNMNILTRLLKNMNILTRLLKNIAYVKEIIVYVKGFE